MKKSKAYHGFGMNTVNDIHWYYDPAENKTLTQVVIEFDNLLLNRFHQNPTLDQALDNLGYAKEIREDIALEQKYGGAPTDRLPPLNWLHYYNCVKTILPAINDTFFEGLEFLLKRIIGGQNYKSL